MREKKDVKKSFINGGLILRDASLGLSENEGFNQDNNIMQNISVLDNESRNDHMNMNFENIQESLNYSIGSITFDRQENFNIIENSYPSKNGSQNSQPKKIDQKINPRNDLSSQGGIHVSPVDFNSNFYNSQPVKDLQ